ncbi:NfeD family protein [Acidipropionibacterium virtanenii]|uniref:NfeD-like C-terminal domain-containing protein n=1 Tax=Acidipropionibacterium virtanenii TaxID=2057246 RepID=A0A344UTI9_9ACTN|nr:NfeD family protein [Acidipropionibacterium virtanenii]AXE38587.1 hypothetical protein JS278_01416 [Acidipropionibacterium virtanenii]
MITFLIIGAVGIVILLVSLILGDLAGAFSHFDAIGGEYISTAVIAAFIGALGFAGALALAVTGSTVWAIGAGCGAGILFGAGASWLTRALTRSGSSYTPSGSELVGAEAHVISPIPADGMGQIRLSTHGHLLTLNARSQIPVSAGERVWISGRLSPTAVEVSPVSAGE